jgi:hypothetical protein
MQALSNAEITDQLASLAQLLAASKENPYKVRAYRRAAARIRTFSESVDELVREEADLTALVGFSPPRSESSRSYAPAPARNPPVSASILASTRRASCESTRSSVSHPSRLLSNGWNQARSTKYSARAWRSKFDRSIIPMICSPNSITRSARFTRGSA